MFDQILFVPALSHLTVARGSLPKGGFYRDRSMRPMRRRDGISAFSYLAPYDSFVLTGPGWVRRQGCAHQGAIDRPPADRAVQPGKGSTSVAGRAAAASRTRGRAARLGTRRLTSPAPCAACRRPALSSAPVAAVDPGRDAARPPATFARWPDPVSSPASTAPPGTRTIRRTGHAGASPLRPPPEGPGTWHRRACR